MNKFKQALYSGVIWASACGLVGFIVGYFGNMFMAENPGNIVPIIGIIHSGPKSFLIGLICGLIAGIANISPSIRNIALSILLIIIAYRSANLVKPGFELHSRLVKGTIVSCSESIHEYVNSRIEYWQSELERVDKLRDDLFNNKWISKFDAMVKSQPGLILEFVIDQYSWVKVRRWRWRREDWMNDPWRKPDTQVGINEIEQVFFDQPNPSCNEISISDEVYFWLKKEKKFSIPPLTIPAFLQIDVINPVPEKFEKYLPR